MSDSLGDRIKGYENESKVFLKKKMPVVIRVDGKAFHTFTKGCEKPFDYKLVTSMAMAAIDTAKKMQGFQFGYVQSDEASFFLRDYDTPETSAWFDYNKSKLESITASLMTAHFNVHWMLMGNGGIANFDARAFNVPQNDVINSFLWRAQDWKRNSLNMIALCHFSVKELHGKSCEERKIMLDNKGVDWKAYDPIYRNGTWLIKNENGYVVPESEIVANYQRINEAVGDRIYLDG